MRSFGEFMKEAYNMPQETEFTSREINEYKNPYVSATSNKHPSDVVAEALDAFPKVLSDYLKKTYKDSFTFDVVSKKTYENGPGWTAYIQTKSNTIPVKGVVSSYWPNVLCSCSLTLRYEYTDARQFHYFECYICNADTEDAKHFIRLEYDIVNKKIIPAR